MFDENTNLNEEKIAENKEIEEDEILEIYEENKENKTY